MQNVWDDWLIYGPSYLVSSKQETHQLQILFVAMVSCIVNSTVTLWIHHWWISTIVQKMLQAAVIRRRRKKKDIKKTCNLPTTNRLWSGDEKTKTTTTKKQKTELTSMTPLPRPHHSDGSQKNDDQLWNKQEMLPFSQTFLNYAVTWLKLNFSNLMVHMGHI